MKNTTRALRRHNQRRVKNNRKNYWGGSAKSSGKTEGKCSRTPCLCSCWMCGNQRKYYGASFSEKRQKAE